MWVYLGGKIKRFVDGLGMGSGVEGGIILVFIIGFIELGDIVWGKVFFSGRGDIEVWSEFWGN